jgi:hypothetical protein
MADRLRRDAEEIVREEQKRLGEPRPLQPLAARPTPCSGRTRTARPTVAVTAAVVLIALALGSGIWWWSSAPPPPDTAPRAVARRPDHAKDVAELVQIVRQLNDDLDLVLERNAARWQQSVTRSGEALRAPLVREAENVATDARHLLRALTSLIAPISAERDRDSTDSDDLIPSPSSSDSYAPRPAETRLLAGSWLPKGFRCSVVPTQGLAVCQELCSDGPC